MVALGMMNGAAGKPSIRETLPRVRGSCANSSSASGVAAVLDSGLLLDFNLQGTTVTMTRRAAGQLSFT